MRLLINKASWIFSFLHISAAKVNRPQTALFSHFLLIDCPREMMMWLAIETKTGFQLQNCFQRGLRKCPATQSFFGEGNHQNCTPSRDLFPNPQGHLIIDRTISSSFQAGQISPTLFHQAVKTWSLVLSQVRPQRGEGSRPPLQKTNDTFPNDLRLEVYSLSRSPALLIKVGAIR